jgi:hypothetical protein
MKRNNVVVRIVRAERYSLKGKSSNATVTIKINGDTSLWIKYKIPPRPTAAAEITIPS